MLPKDVELNRLLEVLDDVEPRSPDYRAAIEQLDSVVRRLYPFGIYGPERPRIIVSTVDPGSSDAVHTYTVPAGTVYIVTRVIVQNSSQASKWSVVFRDAANDELDAYELEPLTTTTVLDNLNPVRKPMIMVTGEDIVLTALTYSASDNLLSRLVGLEVTHS